MRSEPQVGQGRAAIFDLDGVLVDSSRFHRAAWQTWAEEVGVGAAVDEDWFRRTFGLRNREILATFYGDGLSESEVRRHSQRKEALFRELARGSLEPLPGAVELVTALRQAGFALAVGTSAPRENLDMILDEIGLSPFFEVRITGDDVERGKPDPEVFQRAASRLDVAPGWSVVFEDAEAGIEAAARAGMRSIAVTERPQAGHRRADRVVASLRTLTVAEVAALWEAAER